MDLKKEFNKSKTIYNNPILWSLLIIILILILIKIITDATVVETIAYIFLGHGLTLWPFYYLIYGASFENILFVLIIIPVSIIYFGLLFFLINIINNKVKRIEIKFSLIGSILGLILWLVNTSLFWKLGLVAYPKYFFDISYLNEFTNWKYIYLYVLISVVLGAIVGIVVGYVTRIVKKK